VSFDRSNPPLERPRLALLPLPPSAVRWLSLAAALWLLNFALTFHNVWPTLWIETRHELSIEIAVLMLGLVVFSAWGRTPSPRVLALLAATLLVMTIARYGEVTAPALYGRPVNLYWDAPHIPNVVAMLAKVANPWLIAAGGVALAAALAGLFAALRWALGRVTRGLGAASERRAIGAVAASLVVLFVLGHTGSLRTLGWFSLPVTGTYKQQAVFLIDALNEDRHGRVLPPPIDLGDGALPRIAGADVLLVFLESYGAVSYDDEAMTDGLSGARARFADAVRASGRQAVSAFVESPTFGGASWLAHASFMTALPIEHGGAYDLLLTQSRDSLPRRFKRGGYRAVAMMPGLRSGWPEGAFYGFDEIYGAAALAYRGPDFGWWRIPDQYALAKLDEFELTSAARPPVFVFFPTISTHIPFLPTPPYQPDWSRLATTQPFDAEPIEASLAQEPEWLNLAPAYVGSLRYAYDYWGGYLRARPSADFILVMLGDHQPAASISGQGARWDVPVHVIASRPEVLAALQRSGFERGVTPRGAALGTMQELTSWLLDAFGDEPLVSDAAAPSPGEPPIRP
jgi:hypothetical protein